MSTISERVAAGAAFLDEHDPEWWRADVENAIDLYRLDLGRADVCILGQRCPAEAVDIEYGHYHANAGRLSGIEPYEDLSINNWAAPLGFQVRFSGDPDKDEIQYCELTAEWHRVIEARRSA